MTLLSDLKSRLTKTQAVASKADDSLTHAQDHMATHEEDVRQAAAAYSEAERDRVELLASATKSNDFSGIEEATSKSAHLRGVYEGFEARLDRARHALLEAQEAAREASGQVKRSEAELEQQWRSETEEALLNDVFDAVDRHNTAQKAYRAFTGRIPSDGEIGQHFFMEGFLIPGGPPPVGHQKFSISEFSLDPHPSGAFLAARASRGK